MITWRAGTVVSVGQAWRGAVELGVEVGDALLGPGGGSDGDRSHVAPSDRYTDPVQHAAVCALAYPDLVGPIEVGARVLLNVTALNRGLGTGGYALVAARTDRVPDDPTPAPGHLVKARYTPLQTMVLGVDDQESDHHDLLCDADDLSGMPVVVADLHSAVPAIIAGARHSAARAGRPTPRVAYVMTDGGALPAWFSRTVATLREAGWLASCVTVGQAFGGDLEAVTVHMGLLAAHLVVEADLVIVAQGPGNLGTGTRWGFSGVSAGEALNAASVLRGRPIASLRVSGVDARARHRGVSHHSLTAFGRVALAPADVVVPEFPAGSSLAPLGETITAQSAALGAPHGRHRLVRVGAGADLLAALARTPMPLSTMGRSLDVDPAAFLAAAAAGVHAEALVDR
ncbi:MAG TPA: DUF3866 family protein [Cellulomonadaceae bacterium]|nr:DUF3866 family protein [Cellulomonadaceae bacterium]